MQERQVPPVRNMLQAWLRLRSCSIENIELFITKTSQGTLVSSCAQRVQELLQLVRASDVTACIGPRASVG